MKSGRIYCMPTIRLLLPVLAILLSPVLLPEGAAAEPVWEITPFLGYHIGGGFEDNTTGVGLDADEGAAFGLIVGYPQTTDSRYELFYGFQRTRLVSEGTFGGEPVLDLDIHYLHIGGSYRYPEGKVHPFVSGGLGATHFAPSGDGSGSKTYFSLSLGGGVVVPVSGRVALRFEGRGFLTILPESTTVFCVSSGGAACLVNVQGDTFGQFMLLGGLVFSP
jgi:opacity protein-like surface antigen